MSATIIDGRTVSELLRAKMHSRVKSLGLRGVRPGLAVILVGDDAASQVYVRNKAKACEAIGMHSEVHRYADDVTSATILRKLAELNEDARIHGILVQLPLPDQVNSKDVLEAIAADKDVDGFHRQNMGDLVLGESNFPPCTPQGVMVLLDHYQIPIEGKSAVVIGRSNIVGKPMALMLLSRSATVTICTSRTRELSQFTKTADIVVSAVGRAGLVTAEMIKEGATVIDVGMNRLSNGKLVGDVDFANVSEKAGHITPVPGGVGPMTITMLLANTIKAAERVVESDIVSQRASA